MNNPHVIAIIEDRLKADGYDGLYNPLECSCLIGDLAPCGEIQPGCTAGYKAPCSCGGGCSFHVDEEKPE